MNLKKYGFIETRGLRSATKYMTTSKPFPPKKKGNGKKVEYRHHTHTKVVAEKPAGVEPAPYEGDADDLDLWAESIGAQVVRTKDGDVMVVKDGKLYLPKPVTTWTLEEF
jgi:hypothetical protein